MAKISTFLVIVLLFSSLNNSLFAQGCVAIRNMGSCGGAANDLLQKGEWQFGFAYRYFKSYKHFRGFEEEPDRVTQNTEVINIAHTADLGLTYAISERINVTATIPLVYFDRSSLYEHGRTERHHTQAYGLADVRISGLYWLFDSVNHRHSNISLGLGLKLPTGNANAMDIFYNVGPGGSSEERPVDQSIQPGDGGVGFTVESQGFGILYKKLYWYGNAFYLFNPKETNGTRTYRETLSPLLSNESIMSVPDQYMARLGLTYSSFFSHTSISLGGRIEGVPVEDIIGGSKGFRRPGYVISLEPGVTYVAGPANFNLSVPLALVRNRPQSVTDKETEQLTGNPRHGDAAFADYLINLNFNYKFGK